MSHCVKTPYASQGEAERKIREMPNSSSDRKRREKSKGFGRKAVPCRCGMWHISYTERLGHPPTHTKAKATETTVKWSGHHEVPVHESA